MRFEGPGCMRCEGELVRKDWRWCTERISIAWRKRGRREGRGRRKRGRRKKKRTEGGGREGGRRG